MKMFIESICAGIYPDKTTEQVFEYFDYLTNLTSDWGYIGTQNNVTEPATSIPTKHAGTQYQLLAKYDINAKLTTLTKQVEALAFVKATTVVLKETPIICALCDTMDHSTNVCPIMAW